MVPPFLAYYGAFQQGDFKSWLLQASYDQCRLYRNYLHDSATGLWRHIALGGSSDDNLWATGNGWAAAGMFRVLQTIRNSDVSEDFLHQQNDLLDWIEEIVEGSWNYQARTFHAITPPRLSIADPAYRPLTVPYATLSTTPARSWIPLRPL